MTHVLRGLGLLVLLVATSSSPWAAPPEDAPACASTDPQLDKYQYLKSLSVTLRGTLPSMEEYESLYVLDDVPEAWIDNWLDAPEFGQQVARFHLGLLWNRVDNREPYNHWRIQGGGVDDPPATGYALQVIYRGQHVGCLDEPATFDENGEIVAFWSEALQANQEGYVMVAPYWDPDNPIKVCAYNAQDDLVSPTGTICGTTASKVDPKCGCGPNLIWCGPFQVLTTVMRSLGVAVEKTVEHIVSEDRPYTDLFFENTTYVNGPLIHMWRYFAQRNSYLDRRQTLLPLALNTDLLPDLDYTDEDTWVPVELPPYHAGVFTSPAYLLRFTINRRRARQFYESFLCQPFVPPSNGLVIDEESAKEPDLQVRPGCLYCHKALEPASAYWGRWTARGAGYLNPVDHGPFREDCAYCAIYGDCPFECERHYVIDGFTTKETDYIGWLHTYQFRLDEHYPNIEVGPKLLFEKKIVDGSIARCSARKAVKWLVGRELEPYEQDWLDVLSQIFSTSDYDYKALIKAIVTHPHFRRAL